MPVRVHARAGAHPHSTPTERPHGRRRQAAELSAWTPAPFLGPRAPRPRGSRSRSPPTGSVAPGRSPTSSRRLWRGPADEPALGPAGAARPAARHRRPLPLGARRERLGQLVLLRRRAGRLRVVEGVLLRLQRRRQLDHRRQDPARRCGRWRCRCGSSACSSWSILVPQALMGVATVGLLHRLVRRTTGSAAAGLIAGASMALTPVAVLMFRFNNPDALLDAADGRRRGRDPAGHRGHRPRANGHPSAGSRSAAPGRPRLPDQDAAGVPGAARRSALAYLLFAPDLVGQAPRPPAGGVRLDAARRRLVDRDRRAVAGRRAVPTSAARRTTPSSSSPSATTGSAGSAATRPARSAAAARGGAGNWGATGLFRLFDTEIGGQIAWLLPAALVLGVGRALVRAPPATALRAGAHLWLTWLLVTALTFSFMAGIFHAYYTVALAPAVAALVGIGAWVLWQHRASLRRRPRVLAFTDGAHLGVRVVPPRPRRRVRPLAEVGRRGRRPGRRARPRRRAATCPAGSPSPWPAPPWWPRWPARRRTPSAPPRRRTPAPSRAPGRPRPAGRWRPGRRPGGPRRRPARRTAGPGPDPARPGTAGPDRPEPARTQPRGGGGMGGLLNGSTSTAAVTALLADRRRQLHLGRRGRRRQQRRRLPAGQRAAGDGDRRLQRQRPEPDARAVRAYVADGQIHWFIASGGMGGGPAGGSTAAARSPSGSRPTSPPPRSTA